MSLAVLFSLQASNFTFPDLTQHTYTDRFLEEDLQLKTTDDYSKKKSNSVFK